MMKIQACYTKGDAIDASKAMKIISLLGFDFSVIQEKIHNEEQLIVLFFSSNAKEDTFLFEFPWLASQKEFSSIKRLKILPVYLYHSSKEDPETTFENGLSDFYQSIFSGEFKPYGWDLDSLQPEIEFKRVVNQYLE